MRFQICFLFFVVFLFSSFSCLAQSNPKTLDRSPFVGAELGTLTNPVQVAYKMKVEKGVIVYKVFPNLAADKAGLIEKDVIIAVDSTYLNNLKEFQDFIKTKNGNDTLNLFFVRNDTVRNTSLVLHFLPRETNFYFETMYDQLEIVDSSQDSTQISLRTILTFPRKIESERSQNQQITQFPLVVILNSASNESVERELYTKNKSTKSEYQFYDWIENLTKNGFATLRIEKKGIGDSDGKLNKWTFEDEQKSIDAALEKVKKYGSLDKESIFLVALGSSSFVALENFIQNNSDSLIDLKENLKVDFKKIIIEKLPAKLQKTKNQNNDSLLIYFPQITFFDTTYLQKSILNLKEYNLIMDNQKFFWIESKDDILRVIARLKKELE
jgi:hypothetical protein